MDCPVNEEHSSALRDRLPEEKEGDPSSEILRKEREGLVQTAIADLPPDQRQVVLLRDMEGLSYDEIAELLSIPVGTVRSRLYRGREELKERLKRIL